MIDLEKREKEILNGLKDFQRDTVDRIFELYKKGQNRVLVADEVGLGKTLIAKGIIAKTAVMHKNMGDDLFKVVYICSNQNIARQNVMKLKIYDEVTVDNNSDTRLSMQHLKFFEQKNNQEIMKNYVQLIPLTPATSFSMTGGCGIVQERALIYSIFKRLQMFSEYKRQLENVLKNSTGSWDTWAKSYIEDRVIKCNKDSKGEYLKSIIEKTEEAFNNEFKDFKEELLNALSEAKRSRKNIENSYGLIYKMRQMMAQISIDFLEPDLVIMDEFQRFRELITADVDSEIGMLSKRFLYSGKVKTLLLSATPYKLYSTLDEINENGGSDDHYNEFMEVINFLFDQNEVKQKQFHITWNEFSDSLKQISPENFENVCKKKKHAESIMYDGICRTERLMVSNSGDAMINSEKANEELAITQDDIISYIEGDAVTSTLQQLGSKVIPPIEYVKSAPYIFSFMENYKLKKELKKYFVKNPELLKTIKKNSNCWLRKEQISDYKKLPSSNARLEQLMKESFVNNSEYYMWVPPSLPYYEFGGVYKNSGKFSKILVFSAWEMVPRMIASLVSYESERRTTGRLIEKGESNEDSNLSYFADNSRRYPRGRLNFGMRKNEKTGENEPGRMALLSLIYPSITLTKIFNPIDILNSQEGKIISRSNVEKIIVKDLRPLIQEIKDKFQVTKTGAPDERWYWATPVLFDLLKNKTAVDLFFRSINIEKIDVDKDIDGLEDTEKKEDKTIFDDHFYLLMKAFFNTRTFDFGPMPDDLEDILVLQCLGSPGVCTLRMFLLDIDNNNNNYISGMEDAIIISREIVKKFNLPEATAIIDLLYSSEYSRKKNKQPDESHWVNVLKYCADGNLQSVFDEYRHMLVESYGLKDYESEKRINEITRLISSSLKTHTASYKVDTINTFAAKNRKAEIRMRSHYAVGFYNSSKEGKTVQRTESLRQSFNSPFRPFVLATTSIGQEGLDFHYYCRKIMHWNLPSNPVDLEQREGRINRFKGLAIRQNVASKYSSMKFKKNIWKEMFEKCKEVEKGDHCELIPYWYLEPDKENDPVYIERIVPKYPLSKDGAQYDRLMKILSLYRVTLGQARQEELLTYILNNFDGEESEDIKKLFINLSPYYKKKSVKV